MNILAPRDNAIFMRYWRSGTRPGSLVVWVGLTFVISLLVVIGCFVASWTPGTFDNDVPWSRVAFGIIVAFQALVLLAMGTVSTGGAASSEAVTGTIDFHRASATSYSNQALGLVFGPMVVSYSCAAATLPAALFCVAAGGVTPLKFAETLVSLFFTSLLFQVIAVTVGLRPNRKRQAPAYQGAGAVIFPLVVCGAGIPMSYTPCSMAGFLCGYPTIAAALGETEKIKSALFGVSLPPLIVQLIVQAPLLAIGAIAVRRAVAHTSRPPLSKRLSLALALWLFVLFACGVTNAWPGLCGVQYAFSDVAVPVETSALIFAFLLGGIAAYSVTPSYALFCNGLRRRQKLGLTAAAPFDDSTGNSVWLLSYAALVAVMHAELIAATRDWTLLVPLAAMLLSFGWLAAALEYHRLGPAKGKGAVIPVVIGLLWVVLPVFALITHSASQSGGSEWALWTCCIMSACPFFGITATSCFGCGANKGAAPADLQTAILILGMNLALFVLFAGLAASARRNVARRALEERGGSQATAVPSR